MMGVLTNTRGASLATGLSEWELRTGFKEGRYPALEIGRGSRRRALRWDVDVLRAALEEQMRAPRDVRAER